MRLEAAGITELQPIEGRILVKEFLQTLLPNICCSALLSSSVSVIAGCYTGMHCPHRRREHVFSQFA